MAVPALVEQTVGTQGQPYPNKSICWHRTTAAGHEASKLRQGAGNKEEMNK